MELRSYWNILVSKWWLILLTVIITVAVSGYLTFTQDPVYQTSVTYIVRPNVADEDDRDLLSGLDVLSRREEIASTYAEVAISRSIKNISADILDLSSDQKADLSVSSRLLAGTNVLEISVTGTNPVLIHDFANVVGEQTVNYVQDLYEAYQLAHLDAADIPSVPIRPSKVLNIGLGLVFGLILGIGLAFFAHLLGEGRVQEEPKTGIEDDSSDEDDEQANSDAD
jgi:capsular polysaccharide biosynthesis protein